jgi:hypothetical protein
MEQIDAGQRLRIAEIHAAWAAVADATGPADRARAEAGIRRAYADVELPPPHVIAWVGSPAQLLVAAALLAGVPGERWWDELAGSGYGGMVWKELTTQGVTATRPRDLTATVYGAAVAARKAADARSAHLWAAARPADRGDHWATWCQVDRELGRQIGGTTFQRAWRCLWDYHRRWGGGPGPVWNRLRDALGPEGWDRLRDRVEGYWVQYEPDQLLWGHQGTEVLAGIEVCDRVLGVPLPRPVTGLAEVARSAGWWLALDTVVVVAERPVTAARDRHELPHATGGPALTWEDGFSVWAWHGVPVPRELMERPDTITVQRIQSEPDPEVRQAMIERCREPVKARRD